MLQPSPAAPQEVTAGEPQPGRTGDVMKQQSQGPAATLVTASQGPEAQAHYQELHPGSRLTRALKTASGPRCAEMAALLVRMSAVLSPKIQHTHGLI